MMPTVMIARTVTTMSISMVRPPRRLQRRLEGRRFRLAHDIERLRVEGVDGVKMQAVCRLDRPALPWADVAVAPHRVAENQHRAPLTRSKTRLLMPADSGTARALHQDAGELAHASHLPL